MALEDLYFEIIRPPMLLGNMTNDEFYDWLTQDIGLGIEIHLLSLQSTLAQLEVFEMYEHCVIVRDYINNIKEEQNKIKPYRDYRNEQ